MEAFQDTGGKGYSILKRFIALKEKFCGVDLYLKPGQRCLEAFFIGNYACGIHSVIHHGYGMGLMVEY